MANNRRRDPYKNFNFLVAFGAVAMAGLAGAIARRLLGAFKPGKGTTEEPPAGPRPIEGVGTSVPGFVGTAPKPRQRRASKLIRTRDAR